MKILITGSEGFVGQHLRRELQDAGHIPYGMDIVTSKDDDASNRDSIRRAIEVTDADAVIHLANADTEDGIDAVVSNIGMTSVVAQACGDTGARFVYASSGDIYGDNGALVCDETKGPFKLPSTISGLSKRFGESLGQFYAPNGFTSLRFASIYGTGQSLGHSSIVDYLWKTNSGKAITVPLGMERSWCWIGDAVRAVRLAVEHGEGAFNIARDDDPRTMKYVAELACSLTGADKGLIEFAQAATPNMRVGTSRIRGLGWTPKVSLYDGMAMTLETWVSQLDGSNDASTESVLEVS